MTERISAIDSSFLDESSESGPPIAIGACLTLDGTPPSAEEVREMVRSRRGAVPRLFQQLQKSRAKNLLRAKWVDTEPDLNRHITVMEVGDDPHGLAGAVAKIMEREMDRELPLWDLTIIPSIPGEPGWALVFRVHHTLADGQGTSMLLGQFCELEADGTLTLTDASVAMAEAQLGPLDEDAPAVKRTIADAIASFNSSVQAIKDATDRIPDTAKSLAQLSPRKPTELIGTASDGRSWAKVDASLAKAKEAGHAMDSTVNDVILASVAAGFTAMLRERGSDVEGQEVRCLMPVTLRDPRDTTSNNQVAIVPVVLPLGVDDFRELLTSVHESAQQAKATLTPEITDAVVGLATRFVPNALQEIIMSAAPRFAGYFGDVCITNVPGPPIPLYLMGRQITGQYPILPVMSPVLYGVAITSINGRLQIVVTGDDESWDDVNLIAATIGETLESFTAA